MKYLKSLKLHSLAVTFDLLILEIIFQEHGKNTQILPFSYILTSYHYQNNSVYVKNQLSRIIGGT